MAAQTPVSDDEDQRTTPGQGDDLRVTPEQVEQLEEKFKQPSYNPAAADIGKQEGIAPLSNEHEDAKAKAETPESLKAAEAGAVADQVGALGFTGDTEAAAAPQNSLQRVKASLAEHRKGILAGGGAAGGAAAIIIVVLLALIPLKVEHIVDNLTSKFFGSSQNAVGGETNSLLENYVVTRVLPGYKSCGTTIDKGCSALSYGSNPVSSLYKSWSNARLENTLAENYGIEFKYDSAAKAWYLKAPGTSGEGDNIGSDGQGLEADFNRADRATMRGAIGDAMENESKWTEVMYRYKVGRLLEEKFGIKRCIIFCGTQDALKDFTNEKKNAAQIFLAQRVLTPRTATLGIVMQCLLDPNCDPEKTEPTQPEEGSTAELNDAPENLETDGAIRTNLTSLAETYGITDDATVLGMIDDYNTIAEKGYSTYVINQVLEKIGLQDLSDNVSNSIPVIGWVNTASQLITKAKNGGPSLIKLSYITNSTAAISLFMMYRSYADEIHTGNVDATEVGSFTDSLGPGDNGASTDPEVGGTAGAEGTPLYASLIDGDTTTPTTTASSIISSLLSPKAYAATVGATTSTSASDTYLCNNGSPPAGTLCPEEVLGGGGNAEATNVSNLLNAPGINIITDAASALSSVFGKVFSTFGSFISDIFGPLGLNSLTSAISGAISPVFKAITNDLIPNPFGSNMSGGRTFDMMAGGADVAGNTYAQNGIGGQKLTPQQSATITNEQESAARLSFQQEPFFARIFSTSSQYSLVSQLAMDIPVGNASTLLQGTFGNLFSNPFGKLLNGFGSIFSHKVSAATPATADPFGIPQYGYTQADLDAIGNPETYWDQHDCGDTSQNGPNYQWNAAAAAAAPDPNTGTPVNTTTDPCLLIEAAVGSAGGLFDSSNLTPDDLADASGSTTTVTTPTTSGNAQQLAQQILSNNNIDLTCLSSSVQQDVQDAANGQPGTAGAMTSAGILQVIAAVGQNHKVCVTAIQSDGQGHCNDEPKSVCPNDPHYTGNAVDFGSLDGVAITGRNAPALTIMQIADSTLSTGAFGQSQCGATPPLPTGWSDFEDTCNHLHVQDIVPNGSS